MPDAYDMGQVAQAIVFFPTNGKPRLRIVMECGCVFDAKPSGMDTENCRKPDERAPRIVPTPDV